ncbi:MAG: GNAT family N-acyltransferase [Bryobacteraceae bacterium]
MLAPHEDAVVVERMLGPAFPELKRLFSQSSLGPFAHMLERRLVSDAAVLCSSIPTSPQNLFSELLESIGVDFACPDADRCRIPKDGPLLIIANHPFGLIEGAILGALLAEIRPDFRFFANRLLGSIPQLRNHLIAVNPYGGGSAIGENRKALKQSLEWLRTGGILVLFPAGDVSTLRLSPFGITDAAWTQTAVRLARRAGASVLPVFFHGANSAGFHAAGMIHPRFRTALLPREFLNKRGETMSVSIGTLVRPDRLFHLSSEVATSYLRARTLMLEARRDGPSKPTASPLRFFLPKPAECAAAQDISQLERDIEKLRPDQKLASSAAYSVYVATAQQIPTLLKEIGRLREITFRNAAEGTQKALDLDRFDNHYEHLFLWNQEEREIVGAYRIGRTDTILQKSGVHGLYTSTLFHLDLGFYSSIEPALELGRSFVRPEYQKSYLPLLMLWKGLGRYVASEPRYRILFGPVSISNAYSPASKALMVSYLKTRHGNENLSAHVRPRRQFHAGQFVNCHPEAFSSLIQDVDELSEVISDLESDHKGIPILLQHYLNLGGQMLDFSVDPKFANVLDGLVVVDLAKSNPRHLQRYMGKTSAQKYIDLHCAR